ncbi:hypothetical protein, partial [Arthrobacter nitrophenolicus]|uniref:hypothetical protein n=2 Tax=Arthrobacter nitrophenolicus TaxID=683150 RepID=UPI003392F9B4
QGRHDPAIQPITLHNRYQQTWHTIEFSNNRHIRIFPKQIQKEFVFRISSLRCFNLISSIFAFANPAVLPEFTRRSESTQQKVKHSCYQSAALRRIASH